jgi:hypothetical protein
MGNAYRDSRALTPDECRRIAILRSKCLKRLFWARLGFYGELVLLALSLAMVQLGHEAWLSVFALATMPGIIILVFGGTALRPLRHLAACLGEDLNGGIIEIFGRDDVVRLPHSGLALIIYGNEIEPGAAFPVAVGVPRNRSEVYPTRLEWNHERKKFKMCRRLSQAELAELQQLRHRIATRYMTPAITFFAFSGLAIFVLAQKGEIGDPLVPVSVVLAALFFAWRLLRDLSISARLGREHAVVADSVTDGRFEHAIEVLPSASMVWTIDRTPAHWRF